MQIRGLRGLVQNTCGIVRWSPMASLGMPGEGLRPRTYRGPSDMVVSNDDHMRRKYSLTNLDQGGFFPSGRSGVTEFASA